LAAFLERRFYSARVGSRRKDREWPRPRHTRHVWIRNESKLLPPTQGFILEWRRHSYRWSALVQYVREDGVSPPKYVQEWLPAERLWPVTSNPNMPDPFY
jgi:hypothetical protein